MLMEMMMVMKSPAPMLARKAEAGRQSGTLMERGWKQHMIWGETHLRSAVYFLGVFEKMP